MLKLWLIRHGMTEGNRHQRYIGVTDEPLCEEGRNLLSNVTYPRAQALFVSPLRRCRETARILFGDQEQRVIELLQNVILANLKTKITKNWRTIRIIRNGLTAMEPFLSREERARRNVRPEILKALRRFWKS